MRFNTQCCLLCGELHGANLRIAGYEICAGCERILLAQAGPVRSVLRPMRRMAVKICLTT